MTYHARNAAPHISDWPYWYASYDGLNVTHYLRRGRAIIEHGAINEFGSRADIIDLVSQANGEQTMTDQSPLRGTTAPAAVVMARTACATLTDAQRMAFAIELARDVTDKHCVLSLRRLALMASATADQLSRAQFERECV